MGASDPGNSVRSEYSLAIIAIGSALVALFIAAAATGASGHTIPTDLWATAGALGGALVGVLIPPPSSQRVARAGTAKIHDAALESAVAAAAGVTGGGESAAAQSAAMQALGDVAAATQSSPTAGPAKAAIADAIGLQASIRAPDAGQADEEKSAYMKVRKAAAEAAAATKSEAETAARLAVLKSLVLDGWKILVPAAILAVALQFGITMSNGGIRYGGCHVTDVLLKDQTAAPCATALFQTSQAMIALAASTAGALVGLFAPTPGK